MDIKDILQQVAGGTLPVDSALDLLKSHTEKNLGFARIDLDRHRRRGMPEVIFCSGKTPAQVVGIISAMKQAGQNILGTRVTPELFAEVAQSHPEARYHEKARCLTVDVVPPREPEGLVAVVSAGTSDIPVAEEACLAAERMGARVERVFDVGVAGLHRLFNHVELLKSSRAVIVVAGMEGALPSVIGGLIDKPIVAVPTSVGYGTHLQGLAALLAMLNTCVPGVTVVNIDNGFGAGIAAALINRTGNRGAEPS